MTDDMQRALEYAEAIIAWDPASPKVQAVARALLSTAEASSISTDELREAVEKARFRLEQVEIRLAARFDTGRENISIGSGFAGEIIAACKLAHHALSQVERAREEAIEECVQAVVSSS